MSGAEKPCSEVFVVPFEIEADADSERIEASAERIAAFPLYVLCRLLNAVEKEALEDDWVPLLLLDRYWCARRASAPMLSMEARARSEASLPGSNNSGSESDS